MFVSLLQLMGFSSGKTVHSRADEKPAPAIAPGAAKASFVSKAEAVAPAPVVPVKPARRSPVKTPVVKPDATSKPVAATVKPVKANKVVAPAPVPAHAAPAKAVSSKPRTAKVTTPESKPVVAPSAAPTPIKPAAAKKASAQFTQSPAPMPEPVATSTPKKPEKVTIQSPIVPKVAATPALAKPAVKPVAPELQMTPSGVPIRTGRPSSRLAQLTVPSMAQSVASTAAKSSFTQIATTQPIVPPLASATKRDPKLANNWKSKPVTELTDAEIVAMGDDDYMNDTQLAYFRLKLVTLKNDILSSAGETTEHLREDTVVVPDPADRATIEEEHALELRTRDRERKLLKKIEQSIGRIDAGDYGYCDETGEAIGVGRLLARPTATLSLEAQQRRELKQKMFGD